jgi:hypothetical protein
VEKRCLTLNPALRERQFRTSSRSNRSRRRLSRLLSALAEEFPPLLDLPLSLQMLSPDKSFLFVHNALTGFFMVRYKNDRIRTWGRPACSEMVRDGDRNCRSTPNSRRPAFPSPEPSPFLTHHSGQYDVLQASIESSAIDKIKVSTLVVNIFERSLEGASRTLTVISLP